MAFVLLFPLALALQITTNSQGHVARSNADSIISFPLMIRQSLHTQ